MFLIYRKNKKSIPQVLRRIQPVIRRRILVKLTFTNACWNREGVLAGIYERASPAQTLPNGSLQDYTRPQGTHRMD